MTSSKAIWSRVPSNSPATCSRQSARSQRVKDREDKLEEVRANPAKFDEIVAQHAKKTRGLHAPAAAIEAIRMTLDTPIDEAQKKERDLFLKLVVGDQSKAQRHIFFAEREANKVPGIGKDTQPREIKKAAVIGAGTMGGGISMNFVNVGIPVTIIETSEEALKKGMATIEKNYQMSVQRGSLKPEDLPKRMALFTPTTDLNAIKDADIVIEAVFENMPIKKELFAKLDKIAKKGAVLATNTSYLNVDEIASVTSRVPDVLGMHFFSPANVMKLLEIVRGKDTAPDVLATAMAVGKAIRKVPVVVGVCHGFVGNRMLSARGIEAEKLLLEGALPQDVDGALTEFGFPMGPFAMSDLAGIDVGWRSRKERGVRAEIADSLAEQGRFGQKTGKGFYLYEGRSPRPDPGGREADHRRLGAARREAPQCLEGRDHRAADLSDGQRRRAHPRRGHRDALGRHRRGVALRLRLPGLARRPDALGRHRGPEEDPRPAQASLRKDTATSATSRPRC